MALILSSLSQSLYFLLELHILIPVKNIQSDIKKYLFNLNFRFNNHALQEKKKRINKQMIPLQSTECHVLWGRVEESK